jgi:hypothetical protein
MAALTGILPARIPLREVYELCLEHRLGNSTLAKRLLVELAIKVPSWAMDPPGPIVPWVWPTLLGPQTGEIDTADNAILLYGPGYWLGIEFDRAASLAFLGLMKNPGSPDKADPKELVYSRLVTFQGTEKIGKVSEGIHKWMVDGHKIDDAFPVLQPVPIGNMIRLNKWGWWAFSDDKRWPKTRE